MAGDPCTLSGRAGDPSADNDDNMAGDWCMSVKKTKHFAKITAVCNLNTRSLKCSVGWRLSPSRDAVHGLSPCSKQSQAV